MLESKPTNSFSISGVRAPQAMELDALLNDIAASFAQNHGTQLM